MMKLGFDFNRPLAKKLEDQKAPLLVERELNEQELATVTGGWGGCGCDDEWRRCGHRGHHERHHHGHHDD